jgi:hypothetical protein
MTSVLVFVRAFISSRREAWEFAGTRANTNTPTHLAPRTPPRRTRRLVTKGHHAAPALLRHPDVADLQPDSGCLLYCPHTHCKLWREG